MISGCLDHCHIYLWNQRLQLYHISPEHLHDIRLEVYECTLGDEMSQPLPFKGERLPSQAFTHHTPEKRNFIFDPIEAEKLIFWFVCLFFYFSKLYFKIHTLAGDDIYW